MPGRGPGQGGGHAWEGAMPERGPCLEGTMPGGDHVWRGPCLEGTIYEGVGRGGEVLPMRLYGSSEVWVYLEVEYQFYKWFRSL